MSFFNISCLQRFPRVAYLINTPIQLTSSSVKLAVALFASPYYVYIFGNNGTQNLTGRLVDIRPIPELFENLLHVINPKAKISKSLVNASGLCTQLARQSVLSMLINCKNKGFFLKHIVSRTLCFARMPILVVTRIVDAIIGLLVVPFAFLKRGRSSEINAFAYSQLNITGILNDVVQDISRIINPYRVLCNPLPLVQILSQIPYFTTWYRSLK